MSLVFQVINMSTQAVQYSEYEYISLYAPCMLPVAIVSPVQRQTDLLLCTVGGPYSCFSGVIGYSFVIHLPHVALSAVVMF